MRSDKIAWGLVLMSLGAILLLKNLGLIGFNWVAVVRLWPVIIIVAGFNLLMPSRGAGRLISLLISAAAIAFVIYTGVSAAGGRSWKSIYSFQKDHSQQKEGRRVFRNVVSQEYLPAIKRASLVVEGGAVNYRIEEPADDHLFFADAETVMGSYRLSHKKDGDSVIHLHYGTAMSGGDAYSPEGHSGSNVNMRLHEAPVWDITFQIGAGSADFDLEHFKLSSLRLQCGAASVKTRLGKPSGHSKIHIESGAAAVKLSVPRQAACKILVSSALSSRNLKGFTKHSDGSFRTEGYQDSGDRYTIRLSGGVSSFAVSRHD